MLLSHIIIGHFIINKALVFPVTCRYLPGDEFFFSLAVSPSMLPEAFVVAAICQYFSTEAVRFAIFELAFFDSTVYPTTSTDSIFFGTIRIDLSIIIISTYKLIINIYFGRNFFSIFNMRKLRLR